MYLLWNIVIIGCLVGSQAKPSHKRAHIKGKMYLDDISKENLFEDGLDLNKWNKYQNDDIKGDSNDVKTNMIEDDIKSDDPKLKEDPCRNTFCHLGRECHVDRFGEAVCLCGSDDFCNGHLKRVCGTDGVWYPSHCELHRMACVKGHHIAIDHDGSKCDKIQLENGPSKPLKIEFEIENSVETEPETNTKDANSIQAAIETDKATDTENEIEDDYSKEDYDPEIEEDDEELYDEEDDYDEDDEEEDFPPKDENLIIDDEDEDVDESVEDEEDKKEDKGGEQYADDDVEVPYKEGNTRTTEDDDPVFICNDFEFQRLKNNLLVYHCARIGESDNCASDPAHKQFLANIMFTYYDKDSNQLLSEDELEEISKKDHLENLSVFCELADMLTFDDKEEDGYISLNEFYNAFDVASVILDDNLKVFLTQVTVGSNIELKCDIKGMTEVVWKRNGGLLDEITTDDIKVFEDNSLYINNIGLHHIGNYTCQDLYDDHVVQTHVLTVQKPPTVKIDPQTQFHTTGSSVTLRCHADGVPEPEITWEMNEEPLVDDQEDKHYIMMYNNATLEIKTATYTKDTGAYKCKAKNTAGIAQDIATVFIENSSVPRYSDYMIREEFVVFHDKGYSIYEPNHCHIEHQITGTYNNFKVLPQYDETLSTLCEQDKPCSWGSAVNVQNKFIYISQPELNRVVVIDIKGKANPVELIPTDRVPVALHYVEHLDQVWVLCWNQNIDSGSKTAVVIRQAGEDLQHHTVHTQPIGNRFDLIKDLFIPPKNDLGHKFQYGYVVHHEQKGLYKVDLETMKYVKTLTLNEFDCVPKSVAFLPLGGQVVVHCTSPIGMPPRNARIVLDYVTDKVLEYTDLGGEPYVSPDGRHLVTIDSDDNTAAVYKVNDNGKLEHLFDEYTSAHISDVTFFPSERGRGYDFYASSIDKTSVLYINLVSGKVEMIEGVGQAIKSDEWKWSKHNRVMVGGDSFGSYLMTPSKESVVVIDGKRRHVQCQWQDIQHGNVVVWIQPQEMQKKKK